MEKIKWPVTLCRTCDLLFLTQRHCQSEQSRILPHWRALKGHDHPWRGEHLPRWDRAVSPHPPQSTGRAGETQNHRRAAECLQTARILIGAIPLVMWMLCLPGGGSERWEAGGAGVCLHQAEEWPDLQCRGHKSLLQGPGESRCQPLKDSHSHSKHIWTACGLYFVLLVPSSDFSLQDSTLCALCRQLPTDRVWKGKMVCLNRNHQGVSEHSAWIM